MQVYYARMAIGPLQEVLAIRDHHELANRTNPFTAEASVDRYEAIRTYRIGFIDGRPRIA